MVIPALLASTGAYNEVAGPLTAGEQAETRIYNCTMNLFAAAGKPSTHETRKLPALYTRASRIKDVEFMEWALAVMYVESKFDRLAVSPKDARGLMQMTEIAVEDSIQGCKLPRIPADKLHDSFTNVRYGTCFLSMMNKVATGDWVRTLILYNGGYVQLQKYDRGLTMARETTEYVTKVTEARNVCKAITVGESK